MNRMSRFVLLMVCIFMLGIASTSHAAATKMWGRSALIGGTKSVDNILYANLTDGDICIVITDAKSTYFYRWEDSVLNATPENSPLLIKPDDVGANTGGWELCNSFGGSLYYVSSGADALTLYVYGHTIFATGTGIRQLPLVSPGMNFSAEMHTDTDVTINPNDADTIRLDGVALAAGDAVMGTNYGELLVCEYYAANTWSCVSDAFVDVN